LQKLKYPFTVTIYPIKSHFFFTYKKAPQSWTTGLDWIINAFLILQNRYTWQHFSFHVFEQGATASRYIAHLISIPEDVYGCG